MYHFVFFTTLLGRGSYGHCFFVFHIFSRMWERDFIHLYSIKKVHSLDGTYMFYSFYCFIQFNKWVLLKLTLMILYPLYKKIARYILYYHLKQSNIDLGVVTKITGNLASIFYLTGALKNNVCDVWVKRLSFIGRGFSLGILLIPSFYLETYFKLKESKLSLEYHSLYTYQNTDLIPQRFQQEMGIPKLVYDIGGKFPIVASLSGKLAASRELKSHDDSECITSSKSKRNKKSNLRFFSFEGHSDSYHVSDPFSKENGFPFMLKTYQNTKEQLVKVWLNINEKVSSRSKLMKQKTNVYFVGNVNVQEMYVNSEEISISSNELPSNQYLKTINVSRGDYARYEKSLIRKCPSTRHLNYTNRNVRLQPIPIISDPSTSEKKVRFCVNVLCHEYSPRV